MHKSDPGYPWTKKSKAFQYVFILDDHVENERWDKNVIHVFDMEEQIKLLEKILTCCHFQYNEPGWSNAKTVDPELQASFQRGQHPNQHWGHMKKWAQCSALDQLWCLHETKTLCFCWYVCRSYALIPLCCICVEKKQYGTVFYNIQYFTIYVQWSRYLVTG